MTLKRFDEGKLLFVQRVLVERRFGNAISLLTGEQQRYCWLDRKGLERASILEMVRETRLAVLAAKYFSGLFPAWKCKRVHAEILRVASRKWGVWER